MNTATLNNITAVTVDIDTTALINTIKAADLARGKDSSLPMLTTYRLELRDNKLQFITTDRYRLSVISLDITDTAAANLAASGLFDDGLTIDGGMYAISKIKTKAATLAVNFSARAISVTYDGGTINTPAANSDFPKWRELLNNLNKPESTTGNYNPRYLADAAKACEIIAGKNKTPLNVTLRGNYPATFTLDGDNQNILVMLMPVRKS